MINYHPLIMRKYYSNIPKKTNIFNIITVIVYLILGLKIFVILAFLCLSLFPLTNFSSRIRPKKNGLIMICHLYKFHNIHLVFSSL